MQLQLGVKPCAEISCTPQRVQPSTRVGLPRLHPTPLTLLPTLTQARSLTDSLM